MNAERLESELIGVMEHFRDKSRVCLDDLPVFMEFKQYCYLPFDFPGGDRLE